MNGHGSCFAFPLPCLLFVALLICAGIERFWPHNHSTYLIPTYMSSQWHPARQGTSGSRFLEWSRRLPLNRRYLTSRAFHTIVQHQSSIIKTCIGVLMVSLTLWDAVKTLLFLTQNRIHSSGCVVLPSCTIMGSCLT